MTRLPLSLFCCLLLIAGCGSLFPETQPVRLYTLGDEMATDGDVGQGLAIGIREPRMAEYLDTRFIVVRRGDHRIELSDVHRWAGRLGRSIPRALASYLSAAPAIGRVDVVPFPPHAEVDFLINLDLQRFEGVRPEADSPGEAHLMARWEIIRAADSGVVARGRTAFREAGWQSGDYAELARLLDEGLRELADDLSSRLETVAREAETAAE